MRDTLASRFAARTGITALAVMISVGLAGGAGGVAPAAAATTKDAALAKKLKTVMSDSRVTRATSATSVRDASSGSELYGRYSARGTTPASNTKILTAVAAMDTLGPNYRFTTEVIRRAPISKGVLQGNLYLRGSGDPTSMESDYRMLAQKVAALGIKRVHNHLIVDVSRFDSTRYNPNWSTSYASDYYAAQTSALTIAPNLDYDAGTISVRYRPGKKGKKAVISLVPAAAARYVTIKNQTTTSSRGTSSSFYAHRTYGTNTITLSGRVPLGRATASELITVNKPELLAAAVFRAELTKLRISVGTSTKIMKTPAGHQVRVAIDTSMPLSQLLVPFLKFSNNMHAEALTKAMGARQGRPGSWKDGIASTKAYLRRLGTPMSGIVLVDGSGLTRKNTITPRAMTWVLYRVQQADWFPAFYASLPVAGNPTRMVGGTLRNRMRQTKATNNAHAKTGSLTGVTALSGYVRGADGRLYTFSVLSQYTASTPRPLEDRLVVTLANHRR